MNNQLLDCLTRAGVLINVSVRYWRGCKKLRPEDLGLKKTQVSDRLISLGHKRLLPKEALAELALVEGRAHALIDQNTFPFLNGLGHFLPNACLEEVTGKLKELESEFWSAKQGFMEHYSANRDEALKEWEREAGKLTPLVNPFMNAIKSSFPLAHGLERQFGFAWTLFQISLPESCGIDAVDFEDQQVVAAARRVAAAEAGRKIRQETEQFVADCVASLREQTALLCDEMLNSMRTSETGVHQKTLKAQAINKSGLLELVTRRPTLASIGGLDVMKDWLVKRRSAFTKKAREYGLPSPNGLLIIGIAGCGKSQTAKATAEVFGVPLLRLDAGKLFAGLVGGSEANLRSAIQTAEAIAPCVLWIDELEKSFAGAKSSGSTDGGTSARVLGSFLSWMQEKTSPVFVVATANDVQQLPPELLRKGRFDETFFVDLPNQQERAAIWKIVINDYSRDPNDFDIQQLAKVTDGFTGGEIRCAFFDAMFEAFEGDDEPTDLYIAEVLTSFVPLSKLMAEPINELRAWSKGRARLATTSAASMPAKVRKLAA